MDCSFTVIDSDSPGNSLVGPMLVLKSLQRCVLQCHSNKILLQAGNLIVFLGELFLDFIDNGLTSRVLLGKLFREVIDYGLANLERFLQ